MDAVDFLKINPVRLCFFRTDISLPEKCPDYYLFGEYDYLVIERAASLDVYSESEAKVLVTHVESQLPNVDNDKTINEWMNGGHPRGALIRLDLGILDSALLERNWVKDLVKCAHAIYSILNEKTICLLSVGGYSIYVVTQIPSGGLDELIHKIATIDLGNESIVARTTTSPFVNSGFIKDPETADGEAQVEVEAEINITCPLFMQKGIADYINSELSSVYLARANEILGDYDINVKFDRKLTLEQLAYISNSIRHSPRIRTFTNFIVTIGSNAIGGEMAEAAAPDIQLPLRTRSSALQQKFNWLEQHLRASYTNGPGRILQGEIIRILKTLSIDVDSSESRISDAVANNILEALIEAFLQRGGDRSLPSADQDLARTNLAFGAFLPLKAIHNFINILAKTANVTDESGNAWSCLVVASKSHGFEAFPFSIFQVPYDALLSPANKNICWQTLSHELCHIIASKYIYENEVGEAKRRLIHKLISKPSKFSIPHEVLSLTIDGDISEIVAHYLDYRVFYDSDYEDYLSAIWATWPKFTELVKSKESVYSKYRHYLLRSFAVLVCSDQMTLNRLNELDFSNGAQWIPAGREILSDIGAEFIRKCKAHIDDTRVSDILSSGIDPIILSITRLSPVLLALVKIIDNDTVSCRHLREEGNAVGEKCSEDIKRIQDGYAFIDSQPNCISRLIRYYQLNAIGNLHRDGSLASQLALMLTYAGQRT